MLPTDEEPPRARECERHGLPDRTAFRFPRRQRRFEAVPMPSAVWTHLQQGMIPVDPSPRSQAERLTAPGPTRGAMNWHDDETLQQVAVRAENEISRHDAPASYDTLVRYRCECGDARCDSTIVLTKDEYEAARGNGARFLIASDHENPETDLVVSQTQSFATIAKLPGRQRDLATAGDPRGFALAVG
jgi:hypothetical protein